MDSEHFDGIKAGLEDALAHSQGDKTRARITKVPVLDIKELRGQLDMSQEQFAALIGSTLNTVASWERDTNKRYPTGPVQKFLYLLQRHPN